jgi:hypothetical protein
MVMFFSRRMRWSLLHLGMVEPVEAFVGEQKPWLRRERAGKLQLLQRRGSEPVGRDARISRKPDRGQRFFGVLPGLVLRHRAIASEEGGERDVFQKTQVSKRARDLKSARDAAVADAIGRQPRNVGAFELDPAGIRRVEAGDTVKRRALARSIRPDQTEDFALLDREGHIVDRPQGPEPLGEAGHGEHGHAG